MSLHNRDGARIFAYDAETDVILCDLALSKAKGKETWVAEVARYPEGWTRTGGNPGIRWERGSDLFGEHAIDTAIDGLLPEVASVADAMGEVAAQLLPR